MSIVMVNTRRMVDVVMNLIDRRRQADDGFFREIHYATLRFARD
jgi:hypothetical protein